MAVEVAVRPAGMMKPADSIRKVLSEIKEPALAPGPVHINIMKNEFLTIEREVLIPHIPVKELDYGTALPVVQSLAPLIPGHLYGHELMEKRIPASDQHSLQFFKKVPGKLTDFIHLFRIDLKYGGGAEKIVEPGNPGKYPSYYTNHVYFTSRLIPQMQSAANKEGRDFYPLRVFDSTYTESDQYFHSFAMFEDVKAGEMALEMYKRLGFEGLFPISPKLYRFINYDFFTFSLNIPYPDTTELERAADLYEPLFLMIYSRYREIAALPGHERIEKFHEGRLMLEGGVVAATAEFQEELSRFFARFSIHRDDELSLKGWWRIDRAG